MSDWISNLIKMRTLWVRHHQWMPGQKLCGDVTPYHALWLVLEGEVNVEMPQRRWQIGGGSAFFFSLHEPREIATPAGAQWLSVCWHFQRGHDHNALQTIELPLLWQPDPVEWDLCRASLLHLAQAWYGTADYRRLTADVSMTEDYAAFALSSGADLNAEWLRDSLSRVLFGVCWKQCEARSTHRVLESSMPQWLLAVVQRMHDNPARSVEEIAHDVGISTPQLRKAFRRHFNTSPRSYMNARRLEAARHLLNSTVLPLRDIGAQLGFGSIPHFNRSFKNAFGTPPARYREMSHRDASCSA